MFPSDSVNEEQSVSVWFNSEEAKQLDAEFQRLYDETMSGKPISERNFTKAANTARFDVSIQSRDRPKSLTFTNDEFNARKKKYLPGYDGIRLEGMFDSLPEGWNPDEAPHEDAEPDCYVITVSGEDRSLKGKKDAEIILTKRSNELCLKYRDLKIERFGVLEGSDNFFVNFKGQPLAKMVRSSGSMLDKFGKVCGLSKASMNTIRRATESKVSVLLS